MKRQLLIIVALLALLSCTKETPIPVRSKNVVYGTKADESVIVMKGQALLRVYANTLWKGVDVDQVSVNGMLTRPGASKSEEYSTSQTFKDMSAGAVCGVNVAPGLYENLTVSVTFSNGGVFTSTASYAYSLASETYANLIVDCDGAICNLAALETANCYLVREPGRYVFPASVKGNGVSPDGASTAITDAAGFKIICATGGEFMQECTFSSDSIFFSTVNTTTLPAGNALVGVYSTPDCKDGTCLWSWHIWCCPYVKEAEVGNEIILDMPLGSLHRNYSLDGENGATYQWGRKDPFIGKILDVSATGEKASMDQAVANPTKFYVQSSASNWCTSNRSDFWCFGLTTNGNRSVTISKTMYDPCPPGFHVASSNCLAALISDYGEFSYETCGRTLSGIFFPYQGYLRYTDALLWQNGLMLNVWGATPYTADQGYGMQCNYTNTVHQFTAAKSFGNIVIAQKK